MIPGSVLATTHEAMSKVQQLWASGILKLLQAARARLNLDKSRRHQASVAMLFNSFVESRMAVFSK